MAGLPPPPTTDANGSFAWLEWFRQLRNYVGSAGSIPWSVINFAGSTIADIATRSHQLLQSLQGGTTGQYYHLTSAQHTDLTDGGASTLHKHAHNNMDSLQGGTTNEYYHLTQTNYNEVTTNLDLSGTSGTGVKVDLTSPTFGWRDIIGKVIPKAVGAGSPTRSTYMGGQLGQYSFIAGDAYDIEFHIPHDYMPGTDIYIHLHWSHNGTTISGNAVFDIYHSYAKGFDQANFAAEKNLTITYNTTDIATTPQYRHRVDEIIMSGASATATLMDRDDLEPDGIILMTVKLTTLPTIGGGGKLFIHTADIHYQSSNLATKNKSPTFYV